MQPLHVLLSWLYTTFFWSHQLFWKIISIFSHLWFSFTNLHVSNKSESLLMFIPCNHKGPMKCKEVKEVISLFNFYAFTVKVRINFKLFFIPSLKYPILSINGNLLNVLYKRCQTVWKMAIAIDTEYTFQTRKNYSQFFRI